MYNKLPPKSIWELIFSLINFKICNEDAVKIKLLF